LSWFRRGKFRLDCAGGIENKAAASKQLTASRETDIVTDLIGKVRFFIVHLCCGLSTIDKKVFNKYSVFITSQFFQFFTNSSLAVVFTSKPVLLKLVFKKLET